MTKSVADTISQMMQQVPTGAGAMPAALPLNIASLQTQQQSQQALNATLLQQLIAAASAQPSGSTMALMLQAPVQQAPQQAAQQQVLLINAGQLPAQLLLQNQVLYPTYL